MFSYERKAAEFLENLIFPLREMYKRMCYYMLDSVEEAGWSSCRNLRNKKKRNLGELSPLHREEFKINPRDVDLTES